MNRRSADVVSVIEAAYAPQPDDAAWVQTIADACEPLIDQGRGVFAVRYDLRRSQPIDGSGVRLAAREPVLSPSCSVPKGYIDLIHAYLPRGMLAAYGAPYHCDTALGNVRRFCPEMLARFQEMSRTSEVRDTFGVASSTPSGQGLVLQAASPSSAILLPAIMRQRWQRVAVHLSCALRLRERQSEGLEDAEAILSPDGRLEHAAGGARERPAMDALRKAAVDIDRARARGRRKEADGALDLWRALVSGRWTLVDHFERGGRRYYLARPNAPSWRGPRRLSATERQVALGVAAGASNKVVAYELGLPISTVASVLSRALAKLGLRRRGELVSLVSTLRGAPRGRGQGDS